MSSETASINMIAARHNLRRVLPCNILLVPGWDPVSESSKKAAARSVSHLDFWRFASPGRPFHARDSGELRLRRAAGKKFGIGDQTCKRCYDVLLVLLCPTVLSAESVLRLLGSDSVFQRVLVVPPSSGDGSLNLYWFSTLARASSGWVQPRRGRHLRTAGHSVFCTEPKPS